MSTPLALETSRRADGTPVLCATGEIDMSNVGTFRSALAEVAGGPGAAPVVVDLSGVDYLDSAGLTALFSHAGRIELIANALLLPVLTISGLAAVTTVSALPGDPGATS